MPGAGTESGSGEAAGKVLQAGTSLEGWAGMLTEVDTRQEDLGNQMPGQEEDRTEQGGSLTEAEGTQNWEAGKLMEVDLASTVWLREAVARQLQHHPTRQANPEPF